MHNAAAAAFIRILRAAATQLQQRNAAAAAQQNFPFSPDFQPLMNKMMTVILTSVSSELHNVISDFNICGGFTERPAALSSSATTWTRSALNC